MKAIKNLNKIIIILIILLVLGLIILLFLSKEEKNNEPNTKTTTTTEKLVELEDIKLTNEEVLDLLKIYKTDAHEFFIKEDNNKYKVERKNINTGRIDMSFEVDSTTGNVKIIEVKPDSNSAGGGSSDE